MATINLLNDVTAFLGPNKFDHLAGPHGEQPDAIARAAKMGLPSLIGGVSVLGSTEGGLSRVMDIIRANHYDEPDVLGCIDTMLDDPSGRTRLSQNGHGLLGSVFGNRVDGVVDALGSRAGIASASMERLLALLAPVVFGVLGKKVHEGGLDERGLSTLLGSQHPLVSGLMPDVVTRSVAVDDDLCMPKVFERPEPVIAAASPVHTATPVAAATPVHTAAPVHTATPVHQARATSTHVDRRTAAASRSRVSSRLWPVLGLALLAALLFFFVLRGIGERARSATVGETRGRVVPPAKIEEPPAKPEGRPPAKPEEQRVTPTEITETETMPARASGMSGLANAFESGVALPASFVLDDLRFEHASADVQSDTTMDRVAGLLRDHPTARIRIDGHTDSTGDPQKNRELSQRRADAIRAALVERGVDGSRIETVGHGAEAPIASDETGEGRRQNRRTEITLLSR